MTKEQLISLGVDEKIATKVAEASAEELKGYVEKSAHDLLQTQNKNLQDQIKEHGKQLELLKKNAGDSEAMKKQIADLQTANQKAKADYEDKLKTIRINNEIDKALTTAKAKNSKAVKALLDMDSIEWDEDKEKLTGLSKQLQKLQEDESSKFLFDTPADPKGGKPNSGIKGGNGKEPEGQHAENNGGGKSLGEQMAAMFNAEHASAEGEGK